MSVSINFPDKMVDVGGCKFRKLIPWIRKKRLEKGFF